MLQWQMDLCRLVWVDPDPLLRTNLMRAVGFIVNLKKSNLT